MSTNPLLTNTGVIQMSKGYSYYYRLECYEGFRDNAIYEARTFGELYKKFNGIKTKPRGKYITDFITMYDSGYTGAYYRIHCVFVHPDGKEKIIYTCEGI